MSAEPSSVTVPVIPYATPMLHPTSSDVWQQGKVVVARKNATLPPRCVKCNVEVLEPQRRRTFYWHHPGLFALLLVNILVYAIVALVVRKKGAIEFSVCAKHRQQRTIGMLIGWIGGIGGVVTAIAGAVNDSGTLVIIGIVVFIGGIVGAIRARLLYPKKIDDHFLWLSGGGLEFVQSLSTIPAPPTLPPAYPV